MLILFFIDTCVEGKQGLCLYCFEAAQTLKSRAKGVPKLLRMPKQAVTKNLQWQGTWIVRITT